jgi:hypothetical protein
MGWIPQLIVLFTFPGNWVVSVHTTIMLSLGVVTAIVSLGGNTLTRNNSRIAETRVIHTTTQKESGRYNYYPERTLHNHSIH